MPRRLTPAFSFLVSPMGIAAVLMIGALGLLTAVLLLGERRLIDRLVGDKVAELELAHNRWQMGLQGTLAEGEASIQRYAALVATIGKDDGLSAAARAEWIARFDRDISKDPDGAWRSRHDRFDANRDSGVWIPPTGRLDDEMKYFYARSAEVTAYFGFGARDSYFGNTWLLTAAQGEVEFDPSTPNFIYDAGIDFPYAETPWMALVDPTANPEGRPMWTPASYDPIAASWLVSVVAPFRLNGAWGGSVGHDLAIDVLLGQHQQALPVKEQELLVFDHDGLLIVSSLHTAAIRTAGGKLTIKDLNDLRSLAALTAATATSTATPSPTNSSAARFDEAGDLVLTAHINGPGWTTVTLVPRHLLTDTVTEQFSYLRYALILTISVIGVLALLLFLADVTRRTRAQQDSQVAAEAAIAARRIAEEANRVKDRFLANMSHELRTPMTGIIGMADLLAESPLVGDQREQVEAIRSSGHSLVDVINDILDLAEIEADRIEIARLPVDLAQVIDEVIRLCGATAGSKSIGLTQNIAQDLPTRRLGDAARLKQVLYNLVGNAMQFTDQGWVDITLAGHRDGIQLIVSDSGVGMSAEQLPRLFDQLTPALDASGRSPGGLGMGLAITKRLVHLMGGVIRVTSVVGKGTTVTVELPLPPA